MEGGDAKAGGGAGESVWLAITSRVEEGSLQAHVHQKETAVATDFCHGTIRSSVGDKVFYRLPSGICVAAVVIETPADDGNGWVLRTRPGAPLIRYVRDSDVSPWIQDVNQRPKCQCGKHAAHKSVCFQSARPQCAALAKMW
jgi:hypothetical protein